MFAVALPPLLCYSQSNHSTQGPAVMTNNNPKMQKRSSVRFTLPDLPRSQWCDMRRAYIENNLTLSELAIDPDTH